MKKINLFVLIIAILMTFMYLNSRERVAALGDFVKDYLTQVEELQDSQLRLTLLFLPATFPKQSLKKTLILFMQNLQILMQNMENIVSEFSM